MRISATATADKESVMRSRAAGFSLLEILVVVTLIAGLAALVMPALIGSNPAKDRDLERQKLERLVVLASDYSLFRGQLVGFQLTADEVIPTVFDLEKKQFLPIEEPGLASLSFEEPVTLEWELDDQPDTDVDGPSLDVAAGQIVKTEPDVEARPLPALFFFPSGEATPVKLFVRHPDVEGQLTIEVDAMGRIVEPEDDDNGDAYAEDDQDAL